MNIYRIFLAALVLSFTDPAPSAQGSESQGPESSVVIASPSQSKGVDSRVDYASLNAFGPWDDRNYKLTQEDLAHLADNEADLDVAVPAFFRVELRKSGALPNEGPVQYPRSSLPRFLVKYGGLVVDGVVYRGVERRDGRWVVVRDTAARMTEVERGSFDESGDLPARFLQGDARVSMPDPLGAAESAIAIQPVDTQIVIAGTNGPGSGGQQMHFSHDGGATWTQAAGLPLGGTCCDPTVAWSIDGTKGYAATLAVDQSSLYFYRSGDNGQTWTDLDTEPGNDPRRELGRGVTDKEYLHVDSYPGSPHADTIYLTWHQGFIMQFSRSTDFGHTWSQPLAFPNDQRGIGSDISTDTAGNIYYFYPALFDSEIVLLKSTDGGVTFEPGRVVANTQATFFFTIPSAETRGATMYVATDTDRSAGPFRDTIYAAWNDTVGPQTNDPHANHGRIQVAYSRDGGDRWAISTPHETADSDSVDRYHPWLSVADDGSVHVIYYDTREDLPGRNAVDIFHSVSVDGGATWSAPERVTEESSPNIVDSFEFGDYNGLDLVMSNLIAIYTDNREGQNVYVSGLQIGGVPDLGLTVSGQCPGEVTVAVSGASSGARVFLIGSRDPGVSEVPGGDCVGTRLELAEPRRLATFTADANGEILRSRDLKEAACGAFIQAVDEARCTTSGLVEFPRP